MDSKTTTIPTIATRGRGGALKDARVRSVHPTFHDELLPSLRNQPIFFSLFFFFFPFFSIFLCVRERGGELLYNMGLRVYFGINSGVYRFYHLYPKPTFLWSDPVGNTE
ncbi:hypothetical protein PanWU01x14_077520, partial [Parasponia andersonii]